MKTRRIGTLTCGCLLVIFGILFMVHMFVPALTYTFIFRLWPLILVAIGVEMIIANLHKTEDMNIKYDVGALILVFILALFAMGMGIADYSINVVQGYYW